MKKSLVLSGVILFTVIPVGASAHEPDDLNAVHSSPQTANTSIRQDIKNNAREVKHGVKTTARRAKHGIKNGVKNGAREVKRGVKEAFR